MKGSMKGCPMYGATDADFPRQGKGGKAPKGKGGGARKRAPKKADKMKMPKSGY